MLDNRIELVQGGEPKVLITWHLPREEGSFYPIAFQFAEDVDAEAKSAIFDVAKRPLKIPTKNNKPASCGSSDHFGVLARLLSRLGYRTRYVGVSQHGHVLQDRPVETP